MTRKSSTATTLPIKMTSATFTASTSYFVDTSPGIGSTFMIGSTATFDFSNMMTDFSDTPPDVTVGNYSN